MFLTLRQKKLLNALIDHYVKTAEPVSSKALVQSRFFDLSSATLRYEMNDLEHMGYLTQLHISGGRVPTDKGYRFYVDNLNYGNTEADGKNRRRIDKTLANLENDPREINKTVAQLLSDLTENVVIVGIADEDDFYKTGLASLFEMPEFREINKVFRMTSFFDEFDRIFDRIEKEFFGGLYDEVADDPNVFIGKENPYPAVREETVITARYSLPNDLIGSLVLIGPTRMDYRKNISLVKYMTSELNQLTRRI